MISIEKLKLQIIEALKPLKWNKIIFFGSFAYGKPHEDNNAITIIWPLKTYIMQI